MNQRALLKETPEILKLLRELCGEPGGAVSWSLVPRRDSKSAESTDGALLPKTVVLPPQLSMKNSVSVFFSLVNWSGENVVDPLRHPTGVVSLDSSQNGLVAVEEMGLLMSLSATEFMSRIIWDGSGAMDRGNVSPRTQTASTPDSRTQEQTHIPEQKHKTQEVSAESIFGEFAFE